MGRLNRFLLGLLPLTVAGAVSCFSEPKQTDSDTDTDTDTDSDTDDGSSIGSSADLESSTTTTSTTDTTAPTGSATTTTDTTSTSETSSDSSSTTGVVVPEGAIAFYDFEGDANDRTGNGHHGTLVGSMTFSEGRYGDGVHNDGTDGHVEIEADTELDLLTGYTIEVWVRPSSGPTIFRDVISKGDTTQSYVLRLGLGVVAAPVSTTTAPCTSNAQPPGLLPDQWYHVAWTWDGVTMRSYVDAAEVDTSPCASPMMIVAGPLFLARNTGADLWLNGDLDHVAIFGEARDPAEICDDGGGEWNAGCIFP